MNDKNNHTSSVETFNKQSEGSNQQIPQPPKGWQRFLWLGPSFLWMLSAAGSGELLFTPRIAALYGYSLLWALLAAVILKWFINREVGRFSVCTGATILEGFKQIPGPKNWAVWLILLPQVFVAISTVAGLAGAGRHSTDFNDRGNCPDVDGDYHPCDGGDRPFRAILCS
jgi:hypothetical protein